MPLKIRSVSDTQLDLVALGECMIRLSPPGHGRIEFANMLEVWVGGGEYNVAYALSRLGLRTGWVGGLVDNPVGSIVLNHARSAGVDVGHVVNMKYDGVGREARIGLNFTEVGTGVRASVTMYDRGHSATSKMQPGQVDWNNLFNKRGVRWFHTGGIMASLSASTRQVVAEAVKAAHEAGTIVSYDLNFRSKLWSSKDAIATTKPLIPYVDCLIGNEEDFHKVLGYEAQGVNVEKNELDTRAFKKMVERVVKDYPNIKVVGTTIRGVKSGLINDWSAIMWHEGTFYDGIQFDGLEIEDRVGGGDGFASGFTYGFLTGMTPQDCVNTGVAHGALLMTTRGDTSQITLSELKHVAAGGSARIQR
ncbi:MAG: sugar kinase [Phycisphaeraceae bacterium]|nr:sugar kinase [Phycisphaeraceae bacterium]